MTNKEIKNFEETMKATEINMANIKKQTMLIEAQTIGFLIGFGISLIVNIIRINKKLRK